MEIWDIANSTLIKDIPTITQDTCLSTTQAINRPSWSEDDLAIWVDLVTGCNKKFEVIDIDSGLITSEIVVNPNDSGDLIWQAGKINIGKEGRVFYRYAEANDYLMRGQYKSCNASTSTCFDFGNGSDSFSGDIASWGFWKSDKEIVFSFSSIGNFGADRALKTINTETQEVSLITHLGDTMPDFDVRSFNVFTKSILLYNQSNPLDIVHCGIENGKCLDFDLVQPDDLTLHRNNVYSVAMQPNSTSAHLATGGRDGTVKLWDAQTGGLRLTLKSEAGGVYGVAWNADGHRLAASTEGGFIYIWDFKSVRRPLLIPAHSYAARAIAWQPNGLILASAGWDNQVKLWDTSTGTLLKTLSGHTDFVNSVVWSPDGSYLASGSSDGTINIWNPNDGSLVQTLNHVNNQDDKVFSLSYNKDGTKLASVGTDKNLKVWDMTTGNLIYGARDHFEAIRTVRWAEDDLILITAGDDGMRFWNAKTGEKIALSIPQTSPIFSVQLLENHQFVTTEQNGTVSLWILRYPPPMSQDSPKSKTNKAQQGAGTTTRYGR
jgi:WD40 repeat protein